MDAPRSRAARDAKAFPQPDAQLPALRASLLAWFDRHRRDLPWRHGRNAYRILVSELMLQQTQARTVIPYFERWMQLFPDWATLAAAPEERVLKAWEGLGYYQRARNLHAAAQRVVKEFSGVLPADPALVRSLPGVGPYTAGAVCSLAFGLSEPVLDGNVIRVLSRLGNETDPTDRGAVRTRLWRWAGELLDPDRPGAFNEALMDLGATVCIPGEPLCLMCPVHAWCLARDPASLPRKTRRPEATEVTHDVGVFLASGGLCLYQERIGPRWKGLWRFPDLPGARGTPLHVAKHSITRFRVTLRLFRAPRCPRDVRPFPPDALDSLPMPSPHRRVLDWWRTHEAPSDSGFRRRPT
jgi:A/G-specific adenine glycosylase